MTGFVFRSPLISPPYPPSLFTLSRIIFSTFKLLLYQNMVVKALSAPCYRSNLLILFQDTVVHQPGGSCSQAYSNHLSSIEKKLLYPRPMAWVLQYFENVAPQIGTRGDEYQVSANSLQLQRM